MRLVDADALMERVKQEEIQAQAHGREFSTSFYNGGGTVSTEWWFVEDLIDNAPTIEPEQRWIPVTEKLPEECGEYLVTKKDIGWNYEEYYRNDIAYWDALFHKANEVVAWMPLPEPYYKEDDHETD